MADSRPRSPTVAYGARPVSSLSLDELTAMRGWALNQLLDATGVHLVFSSDTLPVGSSMSWVTILRRLLRLGQHDARAREKERAREINVARPAHYHPATHSGDAGMIFGSSLDATLRRLSVEHGPYRLRIPRPLSSMLDFIAHPDRIGMDGIFRLSGSVKRTTELRLLIERDPYVDLENLQLESGHVKVHDIASLVKTYLRLLPEPLITDQFERIAAAAARSSADDDPDAVLNTMQLLYLALPTANRDFCEALFRLLNSITLTQGRMNATNLALVFAPSFMSPAGAKDLECHRNVVEALKLMISRPEVVFACTLWTRVREKFGFNTAGGFAVFRQASINRAKSLTRSLSQLSARSKKRAAAGSPVNNGAQNATSRSPSPSVVAQHNVADSIAGQDLPVSQLQARRSLRASGRFRSLDELSSPLKENDGHVEEVSERRVNAHREHGRRHHGTAARKRANQSNQNMNRSNQAMNEANQGQNQGQIQGNQSQNDTQNQGNQDDQSPNQDSSNDGLRRKDGKGTTRRKRKERPPMAIETGALAT